VRVLVTGASGFIGRHLVRDLLRDGHEVVALDLKRADLYGAQWLEGDIGDADLAREAVKGCAEVYHLAAAHLDQSTPAAEYRRINVDASVALLRAAHAAGVERYVHCSTVGVYGDVRHPPATEDAELQPGNVYERTKLEGERAVLDAGLPVVVVRPAWVYGPGCARTARLLRMLRRRRFLYFGAGRNLRHPIYIDDCVRGMRLAAERGRPGTVYNLAGQEARPLHEIVSSAAAAVGARAPRLRVPMLLGTCAALAAETLLRHPPISRRSLAFFRNTNAYSIDRARRDLGFAPEVDIDEGFRRCLEPEEPEEAEAVA